ncbi:MAG: arsenosugar biosynthesis radical SAM protein ArsS [Mariprofundales bacterium]|nr:arsenosugar biosynthesis radical SAM protein ArsS [Mariprofundales bacterium]
MLETLPHLNSIGFPAITRDQLHTLQVNLGYRCNLQCIHCHVAASPHRTEMMSRDNIATVLTFLANSGIKRLDITGGAPELHPQFREVVRRARELGVTTIDRCNLTVLEEPKQHDTARFMADHEVEIVASLPCYLQESVDKQRGGGVFASSIRVLRQLNTLGYGVEGSGLLLNLVYNPQGTNLPPAQQELERSYKQELKRQFDITFNNLLTITNMPIQRFGSTLLARGSFQHYMDQLLSGYQSANLESVMCRSLLSVDWQGMVYDCDFNQMLKLPAGLADGAAIHLSQIDMERLTDQPIRVMDHCYGCTAGAGSSCGGALNLE